MINKRATIDKVLSAKRYAIVGVSRNENKTGSAFLKELTSKGFEVVGVNPNMKEAYGRPCYGTISELPDDIETIITTVKPDQMLTIVKDSEIKGIKNIWMQLGSESKEAIDYAESKGMNVVYKECLMMYCEPVNSIHKFHRGIKKLFGSYHKPLI